MQKANGLPLVESLESRQLFSVTLPTVTGSYSGTLTVTHGKLKGDSGTITMDIVTESTKGVLGGTFTLSVGSYSFSGNLKGKVNAKDNLAGNLKASRKDHAAYKGAFTAGSSTDTISGKFHTAINSGTFTEST